MKTVRKCGMLVYAFSPAEILFGPVESGRSLAFDQGSATVRIRGWIPFRAPKTIPFSAIGRVRHAVVAPITCYQDSNSLFFYRGVTDRTEILLDLHGGAHERIYRFGWGVGGEHHGWVPTAMQIARTLEMAEEIARHIAKPIRIDLEEAEFSLDSETRTIQFSSDFPPAEIRGTSVPFDDVRTIRAVRRPDGYLAVCVVRKTGGVARTMQKYLSETDYHETIGMVASRVGLPFELDEAPSRPEIFEPPRRPIQPE